MENQLTRIDALETARNTNELSAFNAIIFQAVEYGLDKYLEASSQSKI